MVCWMPVDPADPKSWGPSKEATILAATEVLPMPPMTHWSTRRSPHRFAIQRHVHRLPDIAITGRVCGFEQTHRDARREQFAIPCPVILVRHRAGVLTLQHAADDFLQNLISLPVTRTAMGLRCSRSPSFSSGFRVPLRTRSFSSRLTR
jgi:hypothetical protein